jgi:hypothetical protein
LQQKAIKAFRAFRAFREIREFKASREFREFKAIRAFRAKKEIKEFRDHREIREIREIRVTLAQVDRDLIGKDHGNIGLFMFLMMLFSLMLELQALIQAHIFALRNIKMYIHLVTQATGTVSPNI